METQDENERIYFEEFCDKARGAALSVSTLIDRKLLNKKMDDKEKTMWVSFEFNQICDKINVFCRPEYLDNLGNINFLYELFKSRGFLYNTEELNKLQQAMNLYEKYKCLKIALVNVALMEERQKKQNNRMAMRKTNEPAIDAFTLNQVMTKVDDLIHLVAPPGRVTDFVKIITCHHWEQIEEEFHLGCQINELKCVLDEFHSLNKDLTYANVGRFGVFISKKQTPVTAHHLSTSSYKKLKTRTDIQNIIGELGKKI